MILYAKQSTNIRKNQGNNNATTVKVKVRPGIVTVLPASKGYFNHLRIVGTSSFEARSSGGINIYKMGSNLLITFQQGEYPADLAIRDKTTDNIYLLALMPQSIPPRSYEIILLPESKKGEEEKSTEEGETGKGKNGKKAEGPKTVKIKNFIPVYPLVNPLGFSEGFEEFILSLITKAALFQKIQGATLQDPWNDLVLKYEFNPLKGLELHSVKRWFLSKFEMDLFQAQNKSSHPIYLQESFLWQEGVIAVAFIHNFFTREDEVVKLNPGESVPVLIVKIKNSPAW